MSALDDLQELYDAAPDTERISLRARALEHIDAELEFIEFHFANIRHLDLSENALEWLPTNFGQLLPKLVALDLTQNRFRSVADLGEVLQTCASLKSLSVTLKNVTEEKLLLVMLPKLRILNGTPLASPTSPMPLPPLTLSIDEAEPSVAAPASPVKDADADSAVLLSPSTASDSSVGGGGDCDGDTGSLAPHEHLVSPLPSLNFAIELASPSPPPTTITSPQDKRTLRLQFASLKLEHQAAAAIDEQQRDDATAASATQDALAVSHKRRSAPTAAASRSFSSRQAATTSAARAKSSSVRPTETPASISDDNTDWRKLLKAQSSSNNALAVTTAEPATAPLPALSTTEFLAQLKTIVKAFHQCDATTGKHLSSASGNSSDAKQQQLQVYEQLDRHVDQLALQLSRQERAQSTDATASNSSKDSAQQLQTGIALLETRWNLLEVCGLYGAGRARGVDTDLGDAFTLLLAMQQQVRVALQQQQQIAAAAIAQQLSVQHSAESTAHTKTTTGDATSLQPPASPLPPQQLESQMRMLLEVAESLESDLEAAQTRLQQEKAQRELLEQTNWSLKRENDAFKRQPRALSASGCSNTMSAVTGANASSPRQRIRKRTTAAAAADSMDSVDQRTSSSPRTSPTIKSSLQSTRSVATATTTKPTRVRTLTLKQLVDVIQCILASKHKSDVRTVAVSAPTSTTDTGVIIATSSSSSGAPRETMEQHMYAYLNQRFGLHALIIDYASAIWKSCEAFAMQDNTAAVFLALLRNDVDEGFVTIKRKLQQALVDLLRAYFQAKHPLKQELAIAALVQNRVTHAIYEDEWTELLTYLYDPHDSTTLLRLVKHKAETLEAAANNSKQSSQTQRRPPPSRTRTTTTTTTGTKLSLPYAAFEHVLLNYQLEGRRKLLEDFRIVFARFDADRVGIVTRDAFVSIAHDVAPSKSDSAITKLLDALDPFQYDVVTFSDAASCLLHDIRCKRPSPVEPKCLDAVPVQLPPPAPLSRQRAVTRKPRH